MDDEQVFIFREKDIRCRTFAELLGICRGIIADGKVCVKEAGYLQNWVNSHEVVKDETVARMMIDQLAVILEDGALSDGEALELLDLLRKFTGEMGQNGRGDLPTALAFDDPMPELTVKGQFFCCTGKFQAYDPRGILEQKLESHGAEILGNVLKGKPCCLVVGNISAKTWKNSTHGNKISKAINLRDAGYPISVISEDHLVSELERLGLPL